MCIRRVSILILLLTGMLVFAQMSHAITYAQFAIGGGYEALVFITNKTNASWEGMIYIKQGYINDWQGSWAMNGQDFSGKTGAHISLGPLESRKLRFTGDTLTRSGYLEIRADPSFLNKDVAVSYFYEFRIDGDLITTTGGIPSAWNTEFIATMEVSPSVNTGIAWCPFWEFVQDPFNVHLSLYNESGQIVRQKSVHFEGHEAQFITNIFPDLPENFLGYLMITSGDYIYLEIIRLEYTSNQFQLTSTPADDVIPN